MNKRIEHDALGSVEVANDVYWGAQSQRSLQNFAIGNNIMDIEIIIALAHIKKACALVNSLHNKISEEQANLICTVADEIIEHHHDAQFPLSVWQTGSGTQTNMNVNEVIANRGNEIANKVLLHPNDHVNCSQSSNDTFPTAMHLAAIFNTIHKLIPAIEHNIETLQMLQAKYPKIIKSGRTHLQDATPILFAQELSGYQAMFKNNLKQIKMAIEGCSSLAIGGTAVGTGLNACEGFGDEVALHLSNQLNMALKSSRNKFHSLTSKDDLLFLHASFESLASNAFKIANDIRLMSSGPRCGLNEITLPANEPGSSIMPGKVNPTQCEALTMVSAQVMGNHTTVAFCASQGNFELNVFMPVCIHNILESINLLSDALNSFANNALKGLIVNEKQMNYYVSSSLMLATALTKHIGYEKSGECALYAQINNLTLKEAVLHFQYLTENEYDQVVCVEKMT